MGVRTNIEKFAAVALLTWLALAPLESAASEFAVRVPPTITASAAAVQPASQPAAEVTNKEAAAGAPAPADSEGSSTSTAEPTTKSGASPKAAPEPRSIWIWQNDNAISNQEEQESRRRRQFGGVYLEPYGSKFGLRVDGSAFLGMATDNTSVADRSTIGYRNIEGGFGLGGAGYVYDRSLLGYNFSVSFARANASRLLQGGDITALGYAGSVSLLSGRRFPVTLEFSRNNQDAEGQLLSPVSLDQQTVALHGALKYPGFATILYNLGAGNAFTRPTAGPRAGTRHRFANVSASKTWARWEVHAIDEIFDLDTENSEGGTLRHQFGQTNTNLRADAERPLGSSARLSLSAGHFTYKTTGDTQAQSINSGITTGTAGLAWRISERLDTTFTGQVSKNAVNVLQLLSSATGVPVGSGFTAPTLEDWNKSASARATYRLSRSLNFTGFFTYAGSTSPLASSLLGPITRGDNLALSFGGSAGYGRKLWKLDYVASASLSRSRFTFASQTASSTGYGFTQGVSGGDENKVRFSGSYAFNRTTSPVFFTGFRSMDHTFSGSVATYRVPLFHMQARFDYTVRDIQYLQSTHYGVNKTISLTADRSKLSVYFMHSIADADQRLWGLATLLETPGASTGAVPLPPAAFLPPLLSVSYSDSLGASWRPWRALRVETRYMRARFLVNLRSGDENTYGDWDSRVTYNLGRFEIIGGTDRISSETLGYRFHGRRFYFHIGFPFHIL